MLVNSLMKMKSSIKIILICLTFILKLNATWFDNIERSIIQPDGSVLHCYVSGDQYLRRLHDQNNYTIVLNENDGFYYYAKIVDTKIVPSNYLVGSALPRDLNIAPGIAESDDIYHQKKEFYGHGEDSRNSRDAPTSGEIHQLNVFIRFADDPAFPNTRAFYDATFNLDNDYSLKNYYREVSYNTLEVITHHYPGTFGDSNTSYVDGFERNYYKPFSTVNTIGYSDDNERTVREHTLLSNAIAAISNNVDPNLDIDLNNDGLVDAVSFVVYGETSDWSDLLWPHRWSLFTFDERINGSRVYDYLFMLSESWYFNVGVLCHEFFHVLGAPDLYHYDGGGAPSAVGGWDVMESSSNPPQYMSAFMKYKYGDWLNDIPEITSGGTYTLNPLQQQDGVAYKILSPNSESEYFILEYRKKIGMYDVFTPGNRDGLLIYRINTNAGNGNASGPPDEVYLYRPGGTLSSEGNFDTAPFGANFNQSEFNDDTNPSCFLYNNGSSSEGGLNIYNITESSETISFSVSMGIPSLISSLNDLNFDQPANESNSQSLILTNGGNEFTNLDFSLSISSEEVPFSNYLGGPDDGGYYWSNSDISYENPYEWIDIDGLSSEISFSTNDASSDTLPIGFSFSFYNQSYTNMIVNPNGWVGFGQDNTEWLNTELPNSSAPGPAIFALWDDLNPLNESSGSSSQLASGNVYYYSQPGGEYCVIWFKDVIRWSTSGDGVFDFQIILYPSGKFKFNYRNVEGLTNSNTIGYQDTDGLSGNSISFNENLINNEYSITVSKADPVDWLSLDTPTGSLSGEIQGGDQSYVILTANSDMLITGQYNAILNVSSSVVDNLSIPIQLNVNSENSAPELQYVDISENTNGVVFLPSSTDSLFLDIASRYSHYVVNGENVIPILIQDSISYSELNHILSILKFYLSDKPGSIFGSDKQAISGSIIDDKVVIVLLDNINDDSLKLANLADLGVNIVSINKDDIISFANDDYITGLSVDESISLVAGLIYKYGIKQSEPDLNQAIINAYNNAVNNYFYLFNDSYNESQNIVNYLGLIIQAYYGSWEHNPQQDGWAGEHEYSFISRSQMMVNDASSFMLLTQFFHDNWNVIRELPSNYQGNFSLKVDSTLYYTFKSQYTQSVKSGGNNSVDLIGNHLNNNLIGNSGSNILIGGLGNDVLNGISGNDRAVFSGFFSEYYIEINNELNDSSIILIDSVPLRDGIDTLYNIDHFQFQDGIFSFSSLLSNEPKPTPYQFKLYSNYPNPFNPSTTIQFELPISTSLSISIFDINGRLVKTLFNDFAEPGINRIKWNGKNSEGVPASGGIYFIRMFSKEYSKSQKILMLK